MDSKPIEDSLPPEDTTQNSNSVKCGPYQGEIYDGTEEKYIHFDITENVNNLSGSVDIPIDALNRIKLGGLVTRCTYIEINGQESDLEIETGRLSRFENELIMETGEIERDGKTLRSTKIYTKVERVGQLPFLKEGFYEIPGSNELIYYKYKWIKRLEMHYRRRFEDEFLGEEWYGSPIGCMYWIERYKKFHKYNRKLKLLNGHSVFMRTPADIVISRVADSAGVVLDEERKWYVPRSSERLENKRRLIKLLTYRDRYFPSM